MIFSLDFIIGGHCKPELMKLQKEEEKLMTNKIEIFIKSAEQNTLC